VTVPPHAQTIRAAFGEAVKQAGLRDKERCEATFPIFDAALDALEADNQQLRGALEHIASFQAETEADAEIVVLMQECARGALGRLP